MENKIPDEWLEMISNQESSGKSAASWCRENGIASSTFYYRRKKVKENSKSVTETDSVKNEVVRIDFRAIEEPMISATDSEKIRMIKGNVMFEFPLSVTSEILSAVMRGG